MKKVILIAVASLLAFLISRADTPNYAGTWVGYITQKSPTALASNYRFSLTLEVNGDEVSGHSEIHMWDENEVYGMMALEGTFDEDELDLKETEIVREQIYNYAVWCLKFLHLQYAEENGKELLRGHWQSESCSGPGDIYLEREPAS